MNNSTYWRVVFFTAAIFNFVFGLPIFFAPDWTFNLAYIQAPSSTTLQSWSDFGFAVATIGAGYAIVGLDVEKNVGIVLLGIVAKFFDVYSLSYRFYLGIARSLVLLPACVDAIFAIFFVIFLMRHAKRIYSDIFVLRQRKCALRRGR